MCGICGVYHFEKPKAVDRDGLRAMNTLLTHRGPDDEGYHISGSVGLAMRRLSIIDLETGDQPHYNEDRSVVSVCNGEIYNYRELRAQLEDRGHHFSTRSDCEVIVHSYEEYGAAFVEHLRGMFAIALWDEKARRMLLARDRIGIKPYYYTVCDGSLVFASEIKALLRHPGVPRHLNATGLHHYLSLNYVPAPFTLIEGVLQIPPGAQVQCGPDGVTVEDYWDLRFVSSNSLGEAEWTRRVQDRLQDAVSSHLVSDVPFGAFLSGGIDSSAVVAMMTRALDAPVSTFSIDFEEQSFSEARYAQVVAERYRSDHHVITARADVVELLESLIWYADDPLADSSMIPVYLIAEFARKFVTMVLTGDGGDEVFAGYETYNAYYARKLYRKLPSFVRRQIVRRVVETLPVSMTKVSFDFKAKRFVAGAELDEEEAHFWWRIIFSENAKSSLYTDRFRETISAPPTAEVYRSYFGRSGTDDPLSRMLYVDTRFYLPADMLVKVDRMTMANALEARVPFLDHQLVEFAATIPSSIKFKNRKKKYVLKKALEPLLSDDILYRKKAGFNVPVNEWLTGPLREYARGVLAPDRIGEAGVFDPGVVWRLLEEHEQRRFDHSFQLWGLICFQLWYERFVAAPQVVPPSRVAERWGILAP